LRASTTARPRPGASEPEFAGRITRSLPARYAERDYVRSGGQQLVGELARDARAVSRVLAVDDREVGVVALAQRRQVLLNRATTGDAEDVRQEEDLQRGCPAR
jgi:hypothetical protein